MEKKIREYFKGKNITVMGLGLLGRGVGDAAFLAECGARLMVTDLKSRKELASSLAKLKKFKNIRYCLGKHDVRDFLDCDMVLKAAGVPIDSPYITAARKKGIPIEMSASLVAKLSGATTVGITGTRGKSTTAHLLYEILKKARMRVFLGGNVRGVSNLELLKKVKRGGCLVLELDSWQLQGFGDARMSPHIAIFTTFLPDHLNYYKGSMGKYFSDKANIFKFQTTGDHLVVSDSVLRELKKRRAHARSRIHVANASRRWTTKLLGEHNTLNIACAVSAARILNVPDAVIEKMVAAFPGVPGRMELTRSVRGIPIYNDTTATTPHATLAALKALPKKKIVLIMGGADKGLDMRQLIREIPKYCKALVMLAGTGTDTIKNQILKIKITTRFTKSLEAALAAALRCAEKGDTVLFSPAFASFGMFKNEFDRGDQFNVLVKKLSKESQELPAV